MEKTNEEIKEILKDDPIKQMQLDALSFVEKHNLCKEFNKYWTYYEEDNFKTGYILIDFVIDYCEKLCRLQEV